MWAMGEAKSNNSPHARRRIYLLKKPKPGQRLMALGEVRGPEENSGSF